MYRIAPAYMDKPTLKKQNDNLAGFTGFKTDDTTVTVMESLASLNPKHVFKHRTENLFYVSFESEAALFNACDKTIFINDRHIKGFPKGSNWEQRDRFLTKYCTKRQDLVQSKGRLYQQNGKTTIKSYHSTSVTDQNTWSLQELKNRAELTSVKDERIMEFLEQADYTVYPKTPQPLPDYSSQMLDLFEPNNVIDEIFHPKEKAQFDVENTRPLIIIDDAQPDLFAHKVLPSFSLAKPGNPILSSAAVIYKIEKKSQNEKNNELDIKYIRHSSTHELNDMMILGLGSDRDGTTLPT